MLISFDETTRRIQSGETMVLAGEEDVLSRLPKGNWVAGTIPYFVDNEGGKFSRTDVYATDIPGELDHFTVQIYSKDTISGIALDAPENGFSIVIIPANSPVHLEYAKNAPDYEKVFEKPIVGWISGTALDDIGKKSAKVYDGRDGVSYSDSAVCIHFKLPENKLAQVGIHNIFSPGSGDSFTFLSDGFQADECLVNGVRTNLAKYLKENQVDTRLPLVANYSGVMINVSFQAIDEATQTVHFYAPVFSGVEYKVAAPIGNYQKAFEEKIAEGSGVKPLFSCNCILNYLYGELEGKRIPVYFGPITFGEIAYQLLNQTLVYLEIVNA